MQVLHDAFFKYQTRPKLTSLGDIYYEGKEYEARIEGVKPGVLGEELQRALGMGDNAPPPWLINMQRYGPPPSYPNLRIQGLNAPIPSGVCVCLCGQAGRRGSGKMGRRDARGANRKKGTPPGVQSGHRRSA